jgi:multidrug transporter EmrE-like cation transporter
MKLFLFCIVQSSLGVSGMGFLTLALNGRQFTFSDFANGLTSWQGMVGVTLLLASFAVMAMILSFARLAVFVPLNTGITFVFTLLFALFIQKETIGPFVWMGMSVIMIGIILMSFAKR